MTGWEFADVFGQIDEAVLFMSAVTRGDGEVVRCASQPGTDALASTSTGAFAELSGPCTAVPRFPKRTSAARS